MAATDSAARANVAPAQHSQPSRKGKKAWRKNVDVTDIQAGLDQARTELIQGGIVAEKPSDELFILDTKGSDDIQRKHVASGKLLRADEIIAARDSAVPALDTRKRKNAVEALPIKRAKKNTYVSHKELQRLKSLAFAGEAVDKNVVALRDARHDPWAEETKVQDQRFSFLEEKQPKREPGTLKQAPVSLAASGKPFAAVRRPDAGKSYNPAFDDWERRVASLGAKELAAETRRLREEREQAEREAKALAEAAKPDPVSDEEYESAWESEWEGFKSEGEETTAWLAQKRPERKTQAERNKIQRRKAAERLAKHETAMKFRQAQEHRIREITREVRKKDALNTHRQLAPLHSESSEESGEEEVFRRRKLGKVAIPEAPFEVVLADELQDSLRTLKPEGNLLKDRFRHQLVNGKIEARNTAVHKKPKRERTEKWTYKDWKLR